MNTPAAVVLLLGLGLSVAGCGSDQDTLAGNWTGRCTSSNGHNADLTVRFADKGQYSSSSSGSDGEKAGTYEVTGPDTMTLTNPAGSHVYHYRRNDTVLTLLTTSSGVDETCNLNKSG